MPVLRFVVLYSTSSCTTISLQQIQLASKLYDENPRTLEVTTGGSDLVKMMAVKLAMVLAPA
jgi:hypothetical protein